VPDSVGSFEAADYVARSLIPLAIVSFAPGASITTNEAVEAAPP
jgi:hypothetical protein